MDKKLVQIKLPLDLWDRLHAAAQADDRSVTKYLTRIIEEKMKEYEFYLKLKEGR